METYKEILAQLDDAAKDMQRKLLLMISDQNTPEQQNAIADAEDNLTTWQKNYLSELADAFERK